LKNKIISLDNIDAFVFDFDGVLTNNLVHLNQDGNEWVSCSRADGLAFDVLRKLDKPA
jgi:3-deoxy-D-manno-octulosonate 8-phosphate phosphatase KdsC-like HAD superfamily phosphatase